MKNIITPLILLGLGQFAITQAFSSFIVNGDFENGFDGWTRHATGGMFSNIDGDVYLTEYPFPEHPLSQEGSLTEIFPPYDPVPTHNIIPSTLNTSSGNMLELYAIQSAPAMFTDPDGNRWNFYFDGYEMGIHQTLDLMMGQTVSGWARFQTTEFSKEYDTDNANVKINDIEIWENSPVDILPAGDVVLPIPPYTTGPWEQWSWTAPTDGSYTLSLNAKADDQAASYAYFDNITVSNPTTRVDDAFSTIALLSSAMGFLLFLKRTINRKKAALPA